MAVAKLTERRAVVVEEEDDDEVVACVLWIFVEPSESSSTNAISKEEMSSRLEEEAVSLSSRVTIVVLFLEDKRLARTLFAFVVWFSFAIRKAFCRQRGGRWRWLWLLGSNGKSTTVDCGCWTRVESMHAMIVAFVGGSKGLLHVTVLLL